MTCFSSWTSCKSLMSQSMLWICEQPVQRKRKRAILRSACLLNSSFRYIGSKWGGPLEIFKDCRCKHNTTEAETETGLEKFEKLHSK